MSAKKILPPDLATQNDELWRIVEKQRLVIQNLQKSLAIMTDERDILFDRNQTLERERSSPSPGGSAGGPVPPPRSPYRQNTQDTLGATVVEPPMPSIYELSSNIVSEAAHIYQGALTTVATTATKIRAAPEPVVTTLSPPPQGKNNNSNNNSYANPTITAERQQQLPSSSIDDYVKRQQQEMAARNRLQQKEESTRRAREELKRQDETQMEEIMARRQQEFEEQTRQAEEVKRMEQMMTRKRQEIEEQARRAEEIKRQQQEENLLRKQQREHEERCDEDLKRQHQEETLLWKQQREYEERRAVEEIKRQELRKQETYYVEQEARQQKQQRRANGNNNNDNHHQHHEKSIYADDKARIHRQQQEPYYTTPNDSYTDGSNSPSPKNSVEYSYTMGPMGGITVEVVSSYIFTNDKGKHVTAFNVVVRKPTDEPNPPTPPEELWRIQKLYSDFLALDVNLKSLDPSFEQLLVRLPDRALFSLHSSQKMEQGKRLMQEYLQQALRLPTADVTMICEFLSSNVIDKSLYSKISKYRQGYLTKRGKNFGGWKRRYFVLDGPDLKYYESDEGQYLGTIRLLEAKIGKQKESDQQGGRKDQQPSYKHAFLIVEPKKSAPGGVARHVLCADSDADRDVWVDAISQHIDPDAAKRSNVSGTSNGNNSGRKLSKNTEEHPDDALYAQLMQMANIAQDAVNKKNDQSKKAFWPKKIFQSSNSAANNNSKIPYGRKETELIGAKQVFGIPLKDAVRVAQVSAQYELPAIVYRCIEFLEARDAIEEEGIYRLSGSATKIKNLKQRFNDEGDVDLLHVEDQYDIHTVSGLLKMWLRELPENVLTLEMIKDFLNVMDLVERRERVQELGRLMSMLPLANYTLLRTLAAHLIRVVQNAGVNKMTMRNVGIVFSATLAMPSGIFNLLLTEFNYIFWTNQTQQQQPQQRTPQQQQTTGRSNRNSVDYIYGAPKSIVGLERDGLPTATEDEDDDLDDYEEDNKAGAKYSNQQHYC